jgi:hypothetical protein
MDPKFAATEPTPAPNNAPDLGSTGQEHARKEPPPGFMYDSMAEHINIHHVDADWPGSFETACSKISKDAMGKVYPIINKTAIGYGYNPANGIDPDPQVSDELKSANEALTNDKLQLEAINSVLQAQNDSLKKALEVTKSTIDDLSKTVKDSYANIVFNLKEQLGLVTENDKEAAVAELSKRSVDSLKDSVTDFRAQLKAKTSGTAAVVALPTSDERVDNPLETQVPSDDSEVVFEAKKKAIYDKFYSLFTSDAKAANEYLRLNIQKLKVEIEENRKKKSK